MRKRSLALAVFSILGVDTCISRFAVAQPEKANSADMVFGISLGYSTFEDIKKVPNQMEKGPSTYYIEHNGKDVDGVFPSLSFSVDGQTFQAIFFGDTVFQLRLLTSDRWYSTSVDFTDTEFLAGLKNTFNKKYKKGQTYSRQHKGGGTESTYTYENWRVNPEVIVEIKNHKYKVLSYAACMQYSGALSGPQLLNLRNYCNGLPSGSVKYNVTYKHIGLNEKAYNFYLEEENRRKLNETKEKKERLDKF